VCSSALQCVAVCCSVLQCVAERCNELQCVAVCCGRKSAQVVLKTLGNNNNDDMTDSHVDCDSFMCGT